MLTYSYMRGLRLPNVGANVFICATASLQKLYPTPENKTALLRMFSTYSIVFVRLGTGGWDLPKEVTVLLPLATFMRTGAALLRLPCFFFTQPYG